MPIPKPGENETQEKFMSRCMSDRVMMTEFPKHDQRLAVCLQSWKDKGKKDSKSEQKEEIDETETS